MTGEQITLIENYNVINNDKVLATTFNMFFASAVKSLNMKESTLILNTAEGITDPIHKSIHTFSDGPSISATTERI